MCEMAGSEVIALQRPRCKVRTAHLEVLTAVNRAKLKAQLRRNGNGNILHSCNSNILLQEIHTQAGALKSFGGNFCWRFVPR